MHKLKQLYILTETTLFITASLKSKHFYERSSTGHVFNNSKTIAIKKVLLLSNMFMDIVRILTLLTVKNLYRYVTNTPTSYPSKNVSYFKNNIKKSFIFTGSINLLKCLKYFSIDIFTKIFLYT